MNNYIHLWVTGDPMLDVWSNGKRDADNRWRTTGTWTRPGGAANTYQNACAIGYGMGVYPIDQMRSNYHELIRLVDRNTGQLDTEFWNYYADMTEMCRLPGNIMRKARWNPTQKYALIVSEYNKGSCNRETYRDLPEFEFAIVDSRYRTLDMSWLKTTKVKIWHATGEEFDDEWSAHFDYIIHSDGPGEVVIITGDRQAFDPRADVLQVPDTEVADTIGAGDTLTAAVGVYLTHVIQSDRPIYMSDVVEATRFGIWCCQDVITKPLTAVCSRTLKEYLNVVDDPREADGAEAAP